jgi:hypothetical protein
LPRPRAASCALGSSEQQRAAIKKTDEKVEQQRTTKAIPNLMNKMVSIALNNLPPKMKNDVASE